MSAPRACHPIEDHGVIGDLRTAALVTLDGSVDFLCLPRFDSPSVFAALLDPERGGSFSLAPTVELDRRKQLYLPDTNVLLTRFLSHSGVVELSDYMPVQPLGKGQHVVRRIKSVRGDLPCRMVCAPRFDYGRAKHTTEQVGEHEILFTSRGADGLALRLRSSVPLRAHDDAAVAEFDLPAGHNAYFVLSEAGWRLPEGAAPERLVSEAFKQTVNWWRGWIDRSRYTGRWREMVHRSALMLKLLTDHRFGSVVAAPTFGLPEQIGGVRNWDYRFNWIRDGSFVVYALLRLGLHEEAGAYTDFLHQRCMQSGHDGPLQVVYGLDGHSDLEERALHHLRGYCDSRPVRIGNAAAGQLQLDIYGELMDSIYLYDKLSQPIPHDLWMKLTPLLDWLCENWRRPDEGIWEFRDERREFLTSRVMCWVALDRALRLARRRSLPSPFERWRRTRDEIYFDIFDGFWDEEQQAFVQYKGGKTLDAGALLMPLMKIIGPTDPRWLSTLRAIQRRLVQDSLVYRYDTPDGLSGREGTFSICTFWYVECLSRAGDLQKARLIFEKMLGHANHLGLYAEELGPFGEHLGNFPQAFTHLALISAAFDLDRRLGQLG